MFKNEFGKQEKSFVYLLEGPAALTQLQIPKDFKLSLGLLHRFLVLQVYVPQAAEFAVELWILSDADDKQRRLSLVTGCVPHSQSQQVCVPLDVIRRGTWLNLTLDVVSLVAGAWCGAAFKSLESVVVAGSCRLRRVFTMRNQAPDTTDDNELFELPPADAAITVESVPKHCQLASNIPQLTQVINWPKLQYVAMRRDVYHSPSHTRSNSDVSSTSVKSGLPSLDDEDVQFVNPHPPPRPQPPLKPTSNRARRRARVRSTSRGGAGEHNDKVDGGARGGRSYPPGSEESESGLSDYTDCVTSESETSVEGRGNKSMRGGEAGSDRDASQHKVYIFDFPPKSPPKLASFSKHKTPAALKTLGRHATSHTSAERRSSRPRGGEMVLPPDPSDEDDENQDFDPTSEMSQSSPRHRPGGRVRKVSPPSLIPSGLRAANGGESPRASKQFQWTAQVKRGSLRQLSVEEVELRKSGIQNSLRRSGLVRSGMADEALPTQVRDEVKAMVGGEEDELSDSLERRMLLSVSGSSPEREWVWAWRGGSDGENDGPQGCDVDDIGYLSEENSTLKSPKDQKNRSHDYGKELEMYGQPFMPTGSGEFDSTISLISTDNSFRMTSFDDNSPTRRHSVTHGGSGSFKHKDRPAVNNLSGSDNLDLYYDPVLQYFYDPKTERYYELIQPVLHRV